jgi:uncharacterized RDD family membrane protein YckC
LSQHHGPDLYGLKIGFGLMELVLMIIFFSPSWAGARTRTGNGMTTTLDIRTPEGVVFALPLAGPASRAAALGIDFLVVMIHYLAVVHAFGAGGGGVRRSGRWRCPRLLFFLIIRCTAWCWREPWRGQTVGKRVMGLRVVDDRGLSLRPGQVVVRNLLRLGRCLASFYLVGRGVDGADAPLPAAGRSGGGHGGGAAGGGARAAARGVLAGQYNSFRQHPLIEARLRQHRRRRWRVWR